MDKELLSIGEMAKLKGVGIKALRYYEKIGLLLPAYVNNETGYRYYTLNQSAEIDIITTCIEVGIPLKDVVEFRSAEGNLNMKSLLEFGKERADRKLKRLQMRQHQLESYIKGMNERDKLPQAIAGSKFLIAKLENENFSIKEYTKSVAQLFQKAENLGLMSLYLEGIICMPKKREVFCAVEVDDIDHGELRAGETFVYPKGNYDRKVIESDSLTSCFQETIALSNSANNENGLVSAFAVWQETHKREVSAIDIIVNTR